MPIARYQLEDGRIARFEVPEGTTPQQAQAFGQEFFAQQQPEPVQQPVQAPAQQTVSGGRTGRVKRQRERDFTGLTSADLSPQELEQAQQQRIEAIPELPSTGIQALTGEEGLKGFGTSLLATTVTDPVELGNILKNQFPQIGVVTTPEGEQIAVNNETGVATSLNKPGLSTMDVIQGLGLAAAFTPSGALRGIGQQAGGAVATQAAIEAVQEQAGGEFNAADVAIAGAAVPVAAGIIRGVSGALSKLRGGAQAARSPVEDVVELAEEAAQPIAESIEVGVDTVRKMPVARKAIRQGFDDGFVAMTAGTNKINKNKLGQMINIVEKGRGSRLFFLENRPDQVIGKSILDRFKFVQDDLISSSKELKKVSNGLKGKSVDLSDPFAGFLDDLEGIGVTVDENLVPDFTNSTIRRLKPSQKLIKDTLADFKGSIASTDAFQAHRLKRVIDNQVYTKGKGAEGLAKDAEDVVKSLRRGIDAKLDGKFAPYDKVNTRLSQAIEAVDGFRDVAGSNFDPLSKNADKFLGTLSRRLTSNAQSRIPIKDAIAKLESTGRTLGGKFDDDILTQVAMADELERQFGSFAPSSFQGGIEKGAEVAARAARGDDIGLAVEAGKTILGKLRGKNEENAIKSLKALIGDNQ